MPLVTQNPMSSTLKTSKWSAWPQNTMSLIQTLDSGANKAFKAHYTWYNTERLVNTLAENPSRDNIIKTWKDYTVEYIIVVTEKVKEAIKPETINSCLSKSCLDIVCDFTGFITGAIKEIMKGDCGYGKGREWRVARYSRANRHCTRIFNTRPSVGDACFWTSSRI